LSRSLAIGRLAAPVVFLALAFAGCYDPGFRECAAQCGPGDRCPEGTFCGDDGFCHESAGVICGGDVGAACDLSAECSDPPPAGCVDGQTLRTFDPAGVCDDRQCRYDFSDTACEDRCVDGACVCDVDCSELGADCGTVAASCGEIECGACSSPLVCGGDGELSSCGTCEISPFMPGFPAMNCGTANPYYCSNLNGCVADEVNCNTLTECPEEAGLFLCPCGFVVSCEQMDCVAGDGSGATARLQAMGFMPQQTGDRL
jgi:hypothetical protein